MDILMLRNYLSHIFVKLYIYVTHVNHERVSTHTAVVHGLSLGQVFQQYISINQSYLSLGIVYGILIVIVPSLERIDVFSWWISWDSLKCVFS